MKKVILVFALMGSLMARGQGSTTEAIEKRFPETFTLFFYKSTLRMINQTDSKEFDEMIRNIEKMKFLMVDKSTGKFDANDYKQLKKDYARESYEVIMTSRYEGKNMDILMKDKRGSTLGTVLLVNDSTNLYILDILGTIDVKQATKFMSTINGDNGIQQKMKSFIEDRKPKSKSAHKKDVQVD